MKPLPRDPMGAALALERYAIRTDASPALRSKIRNYIDREQAFDDACRAAIARDAAAYREAMTRFRQLGEGQ